MPCSQLLLHYFSTTFLHFGEESSKGCRNLFPPPGWCKGQRYKKKRETTKDNLLSHDQFFKHFEPVSSKSIHHHHYPQPIFLSLDLYAGGTVASQRTCQVFVRPCQPQWADHQADFKTNTHICAQKSTGKYLSIPFTSLLGVSPAPQHFQVG